MSDATDARANAGDGESEQDEYTSGRRDARGRERTRGVESSSEAVEGHRVGRLRGDDGERRARGDDGAFGERREKAR